jgi:translation initiation factor IF-2
MGHVDHGKLYFTGYIRNTNVIAGEAGGVPGTFGAYEVTLPSGKSNYFLRYRVTGHLRLCVHVVRKLQTHPVAVVVAADDAVMPQTGNLSHAEMYPMICYK